MAGSSMIAPMRASVAAVLVVLLHAVWLGGCQTYRPAPLTSAAVEQALHVPVPDVLRVQAAELRHPVLRPVELDPAQGLTPDTAAVLAVLLSPSLRAVRDQRALADAQLLRAGLLPDPELASGVEVPTGGETAGTVSAFGVELTWDVTSLITRSTRQREARAHEVAVDMDIAWQEWQTAQAAKGAVYQLVRLVRQVALSGRAEQRTGQTLNLLQAAVRRGSRTSRDLAAGMAAYRQAHQVGQQLTMQLEQQRLQLSRLLGLPVTRPMVVKPDLQLPSALGPAEAGVLLEGLEQRRLDLVALRRGYDSQEAAVREAVLRQVPRISFGPSVGRDVDDVSTVGLELRVVLPIFNRNQGAIAAERATRQRLFDEYVSRVFEARSDVEMILTRAHALNRQIAATKAAEPELRQLVDEHRKALSDRRVDVLTSQAACNDLTENRIRLLDLQGQLAQARVALELVTGLFEIPEARELPSGASARPVEVRP